MLRVDVGGDATGFYAELNKAKAEAAKFSQQMDAESKKNLAGAQHRVARVEAQIARKEAGVVNRGIAVTNAANMAAGFAPPQVASAVGILTAGFFSLKEISMALGISFLKAAGAAGAIAFGLIKTGQFLKENYDTYKAASAESKSLRDEYEVSKRTIAAYDKTIEDQRKRGLITEQQATKLRVGIRSTDYKTQHDAYKEVRGFAQGQDPKLQRELARSMAANMPEGRQRDLAMARFEYQDKMAELSDKYKAAKQVDKPLIGALAKQAYAEFSKNVGKINLDWNEKDAKAAEKDKKKDAKPVRPGEIRGDSMSSVGLYTRQFLAAGAVEDIGKKQLVELKKIATNTKPATAFINPFQ